MSETKKRMQNNEQKAKAAHQPKRKRTAGQTSAVRQSTLKKSRRTRRRDQEVVRYAVDQCAHFDCIRISVAGQLRPDFQNRVEIISNEPIGGSESMYSRLITGWTKATNIEFQLKYGRHRSAPTFPYPPFQLLLKSRATALTLAQVRAAMHDIFADGAQASTSAIELTFDTPLPFETIRRDVQTRARHIREMEDDDGNRSMYIGSPRSPQQLCIYEKTTGVTRVELKLRSKALRAFRIRCLDELLRLRSADVWRFVRWQKLDAFSTAIQIGRKMPERYSRICYSLFRRNPLLLGRYLRREWRISTAPLLRSSAVQSTLRRMQSKLLW
jgi:hypothetical protein